MGLFKRAAKIAESHLNDAHEKQEHEDPSFAIKEMLVQAGEVKRLIGELGYSLEEIRSAEEKANKSAEDSYNQAENALLQGQDDRARDLLVKRKSYLARAESLASQRAIYEQKIESLKDAQVLLREQIEDFKMERNMAEARLSAASGALALQKAKESMHSVSAEALEAIKNEARKQEAMVDLHSDIDEELAKLEASVKKQQAQTPDHPRES